MGGESRERFAAQTPGPPIGFAIGGVTGVLALG